MAGVGESQGQMVLFYCPPLVCHIANGSRLIKISLRLIYHLLYKNFSSLLTILIYFISRFRSFISETTPQAGRGQTPLPELSWADRQDIWDLMVKKETGMYKRSNAETILARHPALQPRMRAILLDWLIEVCEVYRLHRETFYLAVDFIDRFLSVAPAIPKNRLQLIGVTCLFIGAKIEEIYPPKLQEFAYVTDGACTEEEILQMELMILKGLNWGLSPMTPNAWMRLYMQIFHGSKKPFDESFCLPAYSGLPFSRAMQLLDLCVLDISSLEFSYSVLATSALYHSETEAVALHVSGERFSFMFDSV